jgi:hypothetical protein
LDTGLKRREWNAKARYTLESLVNLIALYEAWNKPEKAEEWRLKLAQIEDFEEWQDRLEVISFGD